ncbi:cytochrome c oxidase subunit II [Rickettsia endosymbiont of Cardiosporidium cionae]|uniref:cytochrome c oxidase subunit II n=1 Tax=Rickettsia endosymbiont of Cardiosporidium cionae TaxID=2777155 RepID=UPI001893F4AD|nr:cytochrome c oxidase subunit II [Rickettsia endosymbiont of Cardiosporidium cionae]
MYLVNMNYLILLMITLLKPCMCYASGEPIPWQMGLQEPSSPIMVELYSFYNILLIIITSIVLFIFFLLLYVVYKFNKKSNPVPSVFSDNIALEITWTVIPVIILIIIAIPSFRVLKISETIPHAEMTIKVAASQWFWTYNYPDHGDFTFDSYMIQDSDLKYGQKRLLEVDNPIVIPRDTVVKFIITSNDVIHSFAIPALGLKTDAVPGRINQTWTKVEKEGVYYGQCSELCGINHGFMPIQLYVVSKERFEEWYNESKEKLL